MCVEGGGGDLLEPGDVLLGRQDSAGETGCLLLPLLPRPAQGSCRGAPAERSAVKLFWPEAAMGQRYQKAPAVLMGSSRPGGKLRYLGTAIQGSPIFKSHRLQQ